ncbi:hypothetical protein [Neolewinella antarctica]|uniref:Phosphoribosylanthranilate isomerase n=1 Tax=Neolewinella antarctica TaxID=442734 RepID=A0ABX0XFK1_9BACT|nr:hypothetical protein [Neolewinella antarctica]NJC27982.1 phosphoribosylanthranilate isomerase [Neolewinella antarctica]
MLATKLIATGVTHLTDARYFAAWEVNYLAFPLGPAGVDWVTLNAMREWISGPEIVLELGEGVVPIAIGSAMLREMQGNHINLALVPFTAPAAAQKELVDGGINLFVKLPVAGYQTADDLRDYLEEQTLAEAVILDFESGGITWKDLTEGYPFGLAELHELLHIRPIFLQIALGDTDPKQVVAEQSMIGFAVRGSSEEKVGYKNFDDLDPLFEGLEVFD